jgi:hypothetical protein
LGNAQGDSEFLCRRACAQTTLNLYFKELIGYKQQQEQQQQQDEKRERIVYAVGGWDETTVVVASCKDIDVPTIVRLERRFHCLVGRGLA